jgi:hypothetical protein
MQNVHCLPQYQIDRKHVARSDSVNPALHFEACLSYCSRVGKCTVLQSAQYTTPRKQLLPVQHVNNLHYILHTAPTITADGNMLLMDALPNDPELLTILTKQKVDVTVSPGEDPAAGALGGVLSSLAFPLILFLGLLFLTRKSGDEEDGGGGMGGGGPGGMRNPSTY